MDQIGGLFGLMVLGLDVWAIVDILTNTSLRKAIKLW